MGSSTGTMALSRPIRSPRRSGGGAAVVVGREVTVADVAAAIAEAVAEVGEITSSSSSGMGREALERVTKASGGLWKTEERVAMLARSSSRREESS